MCTALLTERLLSLLLASAPLLGPSAPPQARAAGPDAPLTPAVRDEVIEKCFAVLRDRYVFPDVAKKMEEAIFERAARNEYDAITSSRVFADRLTEHLQAVSHDKHLRVRFQSEPVEEPAAEREPTEADRQAMRTQEALVNCGFERVERLFGNVGYLDLRHFAPAEVIADTTAAAFSFLANTDALIVDLRENGGGEPGGVAHVCSYLFGEVPVHLNDIYNRPTGETQQFWTTKVLAGKRYVGKDVYVLTSRETFSGAEEFAYNLKNLKRAQIVGETTGGGAHPGGMHKLAEHFAAFVPDGRAINPITKSNWEGTGVAPDVDVPASIALKTAHKLALEKLIPATKEPWLRERRAELVAELERDIGAKASPSSR
ncbi:MAG: S41 family peptidase [Planctomycetota bacterium]